MTVTWCSVVLFCSSGFIIRTSGPGPCCLNELWFIQQPSSNKHPNHSVARRPSCLLISELGSLFSITTAQPRWIQQMLYMNVRAAAAAATDTQRWCVWFYFQGCSTCEATTSPTIPSSTPTRCSQWMRSCKSARDYTHTLGYFLK